MSIYESKNNHLSHGPGKTTQIILKQLQQKTLETLKYIYHFGVVAVSCLKSKKCFTQSILNK